MLILFVFINNLHGNGSETNKLTLNHKNTIVYFINSSVTVFYNH